MVYSWYIYTVCDHKKKNYMIQKRKTHMKFVSQPIRFACLFGPAEEVWGAQHGLKEQVPFPQFFSFLGLSRRLLIDIGLGFSFFLLGLVVCFGWGLDGFSLVFFGFEDFGSLTFFFMFFQGLLLYFCLPFRDYIFSKLLECKSKQK